MKLGIVGTLSSGRNTLFEALLGADSPSRKEGRMGVVKVPDERITKLSAFFKPHKTTPANIEFYLPQVTPAESSRRRDENVWTQVRPCDALVHVVRCFELPGMQLCPYADYLQLEEEFIVTDLLSCEKRMAKIAQDKKRGKKISEEELSILQECKTVLESEKALRTRPELLNNDFLKSFAFLSAKPVLVVLNSADESFVEPVEFQSIPHLSLQARLEQEISQMEPEEVSVFLQEFGLSEPVRNRLIRKAYNLLGLISFFTVGEDEVRAWTVQQDCTALIAAGEIHSDIQRGFIKAETVSYEGFAAVDFSMPEARKKAFLRLEGKQYIVQDGDIINFKFNV